MNRIEIKLKPSKVFLACLLFLVSAGSSAQDWNQWRGADRDSRSDGDPWPDSLGDDVLTEAWRIDQLGPSYSSPVVVGGVIYITEQDASDREGIVALEEKSGDPIWKRYGSVAFTMPRSMRQHGSWPKSTPVVEGSDLFFLGIDEKLHHLDSQTGESRWSLDFPSRFGTPIPEFGSSSSPLVQKDSVYVQAAGSLFAIERTTGKVRWRALNLFRPGVGEPVKPEEEEYQDHEAYGSPISWTAEGVEQIVANTVEGLVGVDALSGEVLWQVATERGAADSPNITPIIWRDSVLTSTENSGTVLYRISRSGKLSAKELWRHKARGDMSSPVIAGDHAYLHLKNGRMAGFNLHSGETAWISKPIFGSYSSTVVRGDKMLVLSAGGELRLMAADPERLRILDSRQVADNAWAHLTARGNRIYVRSLESLAVFDWATPMDQTHELSAAGAGL